MTLIKSISGIRGTIGGKPGESLSPVDIVKFSAAYGTMCMHQFPREKNHVVIGRDARVSGEIVSQLVINTLVSLGMNVTDIGLASTPTVELAVQQERADGGIILTASHNPYQWNALKLLNNRGEFISKQQGTELLSIAEKEDFEFAGIDNLGKLSVKQDYHHNHIKHILSLKLVNIKAIEQAGFVIAIDGINSVGGVIVPELLKALGVKKVIEINCLPDGKFAHNAEPLPEHLNEISRVVRETEADLGFVVDPDVDRLAIINEDGSMFGEEYTIVAVSDYILQNTPGNTVSNLSSSLALRDITENHGGTYYASAVGEVNVVRKMKDVNAVIGGEGNGGVIYPESHYGRDALVGIALFLSYLALLKTKSSSLRASYPEYFISKNKLTLEPGTDIDNIIQHIREKYSDQKLNIEDGLKIEFEKEWIHLRKSNTEPIIRIYAESSSKEKADKLAEKMIKELQELR
jgi:phosphomannomutase